MRNASRKIFTENATDFSFGAFEMKLSTFMNSPFRTVRRLTIFLFFLSVTAFPLMAQETVFKNSGSDASLIELYSSEGCSSCPPAEAWTNGLKGAPGLWKNIFPLTFHVDYWDGLGWPDRFAKPTYTLRQRHYAAVLGQDSVYTPEFFLNGMEWRRGAFDGLGLPSERTKTSGELSFALSENKNIISALYVPSVTGKQLTFNAVLLGFDIFTNVQRGENRGKKLKHDFVVLNFSSMPMTSKNGHSYESGPLEIASSITDQPGAVVAWVSATDGAILQMAGGWFPHAGQNRN